MSLDWSQGFSHDDDTHQFGNWIDRRRLGLEFEKCKTFFVSRSIQHGTPGTGRGPSVLMDVDHRLLGKPPAFHGRDEEWADWVFATRAYLETLSEDIGDKLGVVHNDGRRLVLSHMS